MSKVCLIVSLRESESRDEEPAPVPKDKANDTYGLGYEVSDDGVWFECRL